MPYQTERQKEHKTAIVEKFRTQTTDVGSTPVQVALLTDRINMLTSHLRSNKKDFSTQRGLLKLVGQRRKLLEYLKGSDPSRYTKLIADLELRK